MEKKQYKKYDFFGEFFHYAGTKVAAGIVEFIGTIIENTIDWSV